VVARFSLKHYTSGHATTPDFALETVHTHGAERSTLNLHGRWHRRLLDPCPMRVRSERFESKSFIRLASDNPAQVGRASRHQTSRDTRENAQVRQPVQCHSSCRPQLPVTMSRPQPRVSGCQNQLGAFVPADRRPGRPYLECRRTPVVSRRMMAWPWVGSGSHAFSRATGRFRLRATAHLTVCRLILGIFTQFAPHLTRLTLSRIGGRGIAPWTNDGTTGHVTGPVRMLGIQARAARTGRVASRRSDSITTGYRSMGRNCLN
jgi:hypothetical protein